MSSTFLALHYPIVFSTKNSRPIIEPAWERQLHDYLGGTADHVHLLVGLSSIHRLADFMRELKKASSSWSHQYDKAFAWQEGYGAFTVSPTTRAAVRGYIANQAQHHAKKSFREELIELLTKAEVSYEERFLD